jgi:enoyl-CoA hydratase/carnithine racemase
LWLAVNGSPGESSGMPDATTPSAMQTMRRPMASYVGQHVRWSCSADGRVATITLDRPDRRNPLTFESYRELRDLFRALPDASDVRTIVLTGAGEHFSSGGDVFEIIEPLTKMPMPDLLAFTRLTGDVVKAMRRCPQQIIAAVDGVCVGAGAILAMASDLRIATSSARTAFLFAKVGLAGADMGACGILPRIIGQGRAAELLYTARTMSAEEGLAWGFFNTLVSRDTLISEAESLARALADGPAFAHAMTKQMLDREWAMSVDDLIDAEAQAQAICMATDDFRIAFEAFARKATPVFTGQ